MGHQSERMTHTYSNKGGQRRTQSRRKNDIHFVNEAQQPDELKAHQTLTGEATISTVVKQVTSTSSTFRWDVKLNERHLPDELKNLLRL